MKKIFLIASIFFTLSLNAQTSKDLIELQKLSQFMRYLSGTYVDTLNTSAIVEGAINQMLSTLDPHSAYVSAKEMKDVQESFNANFEGIGIEFNVLKDTLIVVNTIQGGPSENVGLLPNDRIIMVGDSSIIGITQTGVPKLLRGPKGTSIDVKVIRHGTKELLKFHIVRDKIPIYTVDAAYKVNDKTGYVKINRFAATTNSELKEAFKSLTAIESLIVDLRGNGGGYLDQAISVSNNFLKRGSVVVSTEGRTVPTEKLIAEANPIFEKGNLVILVDEFSASASEIVAGAIQDWDRGLIIGRRTFGKGLVQRQFPLVDGSAVRITVARYHTPSGRVIQRHYVNGETDKYYSDFSDMLKGDSLNISTDTLKYKTLISSRTVYGGGGITPDIIVHRDTMAYSKYWATLVRQGVFNEYIVDYIDKNRKILEKEYTSFKKFDNEFEVSEAMLNSIIELGKTKGIEYNDSDMQRSKNEMMIQLKAVIAQKLWNTSQYFEIINKRSDMEFKKAVEILNNWNNYNTGIVN